MSKKEVAKEEKPKQVPMSEAEQAVKHNHAEVLSHLNAHFNGTGKEKKRALPNLEVAFKNLGDAAGKVHEEKG